MYPLIIALTFLIDIVDVAMPFPLVTDTPYDEKLRDDYMNISMNCIFKICLICWLIICYKFAMFNTSINRFFFNLFYVFILLVIIFI